jgi:PhnB protein
MSIKSASPYLNFNGDAAKAIQLYETALGAKTEYVMPFSAAPGLEKSPDKDRIMHAALRVDDTVLMLSDTMPDRPVPAGGNVQVALTCDDVADMTKKFDALAASGQVTFPLHDAFWGAKFGMLTDAFGINWIFNCPTKTG